MRQLLSNDVLRCCLKNVGDEEGGNIGFRSQNSLAIPLFSLPFPREARGDYKVARLQSAELRSKRDFALCSERSESPESGNTTPPRRSRALTLFTITFLGNYHTHH